MEKRTNFTFMYWWCMYKDALTLEQWSELEELIFKYGLDGEYTDPETIKDLSVRCAWAGISEYMCTEEYCCL